MSCGAAAVRNLILIGARGAGKSSVGRQLAGRLDWEFVDIDERIEAQAGRTIRDIFAQDGEAGFRGLETGVIAQVVCGAQQVISAGGGAVLAENNRTALRAAGRCVWLAAPAEELYRRTQSDPRSAATRPPLTAQSGLDEMRHLLAQREPLYASLADHVVPTAGQSIEQVVEAVLTVLDTNRVGVDTRDAPRAP